MAMLVGFLVLTVGGESHAGEIPTPDRISVVVAPDTRVDDQALVEWAVARFDAAGLELPEVTVTFHDDLGPCAGNSGRYRDGDPPRIDLCVPDDQPNCRRLTVLHELGHAWAESRTSVAVRSVFLAERGLTAWVDADCPPHRWGAEHAAEVVSWALMEEPIRIVRIHDVEPARLAVAFEVLTGRQPLVTGWAEPATG